MQSLRDLGVNISEEQAEKILRRLDNAVIHWTHLSKWLGSIIFLGVTFVVIKLAALFSLASFTHARLGLIVSVNGNLTFHHHIWSIPFLSRKVQTEICTFLCPVQFLQCWVFQEVTVSAHLGHQPLLHWQFQSLLGTQSVIQIQWHTSNWTLNKTFFLQYFWYYLLMHSCPLNYSQFTVANISLYNFPKPLSYNTIKINKRPVTYKPASRPLIHTAFVDLIGTHHPWGI